MNKKNIFEDLKYIDSLNKNNDLTNNDLTNNDLTNNDLKNNDLTNNNLINNNLINNNLINNNLINNEFNEKINKKLNEKSKEQLMNIHDIIYNNKVIFNDYVFIKNNLEINGITNFKNSINIHDNIFINKILNVYGNSNFCGKVNFNDELNIKNKSYFNEEVFFNETVNIDDLNIIGKTIFENDVMFEKDVYIDNLQVLKSNIDFLEIDKLNVFNEALFNNLSIKNKLELNGIALFNNEVLFNEKSIFKNISHFDNLITDCLHVNNQSIFEKSSTFMDDLFIEKRLGVYNKALFEDDVLIEENLEVYGKSILNDVNIKNNLNIKETIFSKNLNIQNNTYLNKLFVNDLNLKNNIHVNSNGLNIIGGPLNITSSNNELINKKSKLSFIIESKDENVDSIFKKNDAIILFDNNENNNLHITNSLNKGIIIDNNYISINNKLKVNDVFFYEIYGNCEKNITYSNIHKIGFNIKNCGLISNCDEWNNGIFTISIDGYYSLHANFLCFNIEPNTRLLCFIGDIEQICISNGNFTNKEFLYNYSITKYLKKGEQIYFSPEKGSNITLILNGKKATYINIIRLF
jgi:hypothetical protein